MQGRDFRNFVIQVVCCLMLLHGPPLMALEHTELRGWSEPEWLTEMSWPDLPPWPSTRDLAGARWLTDLLSRVRDADGEVNGDVWEQDEVDLIPPRTIADRWATRSGAAGSSAQQVPSLPVQLQGKKARSVAYAEKKPEPRSFSPKQRTATSATKAASHPDVAALAGQLENVPARVLTFVHDTIDLDRRWGAFRSPLQTLREGRGTAWDQAALLQDLLAAGGVDARFVWGEIELHPEVLASFAGVDDPWRAGDLLTTAGVPIVLLTEGNEVKAARMQHVWLEAWIDYSPHRGARVGAGDQWVTLDPTLKRFEHTTGQPTDVSFDLAAFLESGTEASPREEYEAALAGSLPGSTIEDVKPTSTLVVANFPFVPGVLAAKILSVEGQTAEVPDAYLQQITFEMRDGNGRTLLAHDVTASAISGKSLEIAWPGATSADVATLELYGSIFAAPPFEVSLKPVLRIDGVDIVTGEPIGSAEDVTLEITFTSPGRGLTVVPFELLAGEPAAFLAEQPTQAMLDASTGLAKAAVIYGDRLRANLEHLAVLRGQVLLPLDVVALAIERGARSVSPDGTPLTFSPGPRTVDLGAMTVGLFPANGVWPSAEDSRATLGLLGAQSSHLEGEAIVEVFGGEPLTSVGLLTRAAREGQAILRVDSTNVGAVLAQVRLGKEAEDAIRAGVAQGRIAWIHEEQLPFETWQTSAYVLEDPNTGAAGFFVTFERIVEAIEGLVEFHAPVDLDVITAPTDIIATINSEQLTNWTLSHRPVGEATSTVIATGTGPVQNATLGQFDPTLLLNGLHEIVLTGTDAAGQQIVGKIAVAVEGNMKIGHFTLSFVDLAIPLSGLDIEIVRTYDSRQRLLQGDFGQGWTLDIRQGSYRNNRPPGDGWQFQTGFLPCDSILETKSHVTTVRLSDQEVYRFRLLLSNGAPTQGGCFAEAGFEYVDGPLPGSTLEIVGNASVFYENGGDRVIDVDSLDVFVPQDVLLTTRDGRIFELDLEVGVTRLEDLNGNALDITPDGITHSSGRGVDFERDAEGRIVQISDPLNQALVYDYSVEGDLVSVTERDGAATRFSYLEGHLLEEILNSLGVRAVRSEFDDEGRVIRTVDAEGRAVELEHDLDARREVARNRLGFVKVFEYDGRGNVILEIDESGERTTRLFDDRDNLLMVVDPLDRVTRFTYSAANDLLGILDPLGNSTRFTYDERGQPLTVVDPLGQVTVNVFDEAGNLLRVTDAEGNASSFTYSDAGELITVADPLGHTSRYEYDAFGNVIREIDALGLETVSTYDENGRLLTQSRSRSLADGSTESIVNRFEYDELGRPIQSTAPDGSTTEMGYDLLGKLIRRVDALGRMTRFEHDLFGRLAKVIHADGGEETRSYDAEGRLVTQVDRAGRATSFTLDPVGRLLSTTHPDGAVDTTVYDAAGQRIASIDPLGRVTTFVYDDAGRLAETVDALGQTIRQAYDAAGQRVAMTDARGYETRFIHDAVGRQISTLFPNGTSLRVEYDAAGRRVAEIDEEGNRTRFEYDASNRLIAVRDAMDQVTRYGYDEIDNLVSQTDANGRVTRFGYDSLGRETYRVLPDGAVEAMSYNADGTLASRTDFKGATTVYGYDELARLVSRVPSGGGAVSFTYTSTGRRATASDARGATQYFYDDRERLVRKIEPDGSELLHAYDLSGNRTSLTAKVAGQSFTTAYEYDALNRPIEVRDSGGGEFTHTYDSSGNLATLTHPSGTVTTRSWDSRNRLLELETRDAIGSVLQSHVYELSPTGRRLGVSEHDGTTRRWSYDSLHRLVEERVTAGADELVFQTSFTYDAVGNRFSQETLNGQGDLELTEHTYDERDRLTSRGAASYSWDANGNLLSMSEGGTPTVSYGWDSQDRLVTASLANGSEVAFTYDADGHRVATEVPADSAPEVTSHLVDDSGSVSQVVLDVDSSSIVQAAYTHAGRLLGLERPGSSERREHHADGLGSVRVLTDGSGAVTDRYTFSAFGEVLGRVGEDENPYLFAGERWVSELSLYDLRARWMMPGVGRFMSMDPFSGVIRKPLSLHRYQYGDLDPVNKVDPLGMFAASAAEASLAAGIASEISLIQVNVFLEALKSTKFGNDPGLRRVLGTVEAIQLGAAAVAVSAGIFIAATAIGGRLFRRVIKVGNFGISRGPGRKIVLDLFGGEASQIPGAVNVDLVARKGVRADVGTLPFKTASVDEVVASGPRSGFLEEASRALKPGGQIFINFTARNRFANLPSKDELERLGLTVVIEKGNLLPRFNELVFRFSDGTEFREGTRIFTTVLRKE